MILPPSPSNYNACLVKTYHLYCFYFAALPVPDQKWQKRGLGLPRLVLPIGVDPSHPTWRWASTCHSCCLLTSWRRHLSGPAFLLRVEGLPSRCFVWKRKGWRGAGQLVPRANKNYPYPRVASLALYAHLYVVGSLGNVVPAKQTSIGRADYCQIAGCCSHFTFLLSLQIFGLCVEKQT